MSVDDLSDVEDTAFIAPSVGYRPMTLGTYRALLRAGCSILTGSIADPQSPDGMATLLRDAGIYSALHRHGADWDAAMRAIFCGDPSQLESLITHELDVIQWEGIERAAQAMKDSVEALTTAANKTIVGEKKTPLSGGSRETSQDTSH